jgi:hypothetical protein
MPATLTRIARQAEERPEYCAFLLRAYLNEYTAFTLDDLALLLRCAPDRLSLLWLCGRPGECWKDDVDCIARSIGCDGDVLAQLLWAALELS